ncbi:MAG: IS256 family transposase [Myxococcota bacterium]
MPRKPKKSPPSAVDQLVEELLKQSEDPAELLGKDGLFRELKARVLERMLQEEMTHHLGYGPGESKPSGQSNARNGTSKKTVLTGDGPVEIAVPRDREGDFEPIAVPKHTRRLEGFDDKVIYLYSYGNSQRHIAEQIQEFYGVKVSADLISTVTDGVLDEMKRWRSRPLQEVYPIVYFDCLFIPIRAGGWVRKHAVYIAMGIDMEGHKDILGMWIEESEGAKFWLKVFNELKNRGVQDILVACCDGLSGFPEALQAAFPHIVVQTCVVHQIRNALKRVAHTDRKAVATDLKPIYKAPTAESALEDLEAFEEKWGEKYPSIATSWLNHWDTLSPFYSFPQPIRRLIYTTNPIEAFNRQLRQVFKTKGPLPSEQATFKLMYLAIRRIRKKWTKALRNWKVVIQQFAIFFEGRVKL